MDLPTRPMTDCFTEHYEIDIRVRDEGEDEQGIRSRHVAVWLIDNEYTQARAPKQIGARSFRYAPGAERAVRDGINLFVRDLLFVGRRLG